MASYQFNLIEKYWQKYWAEKQTFKAENISEKPKYYVLDMFPYPSGAGLHVGHPLGYIASDIVSRFKRHKGFNVLHPMGYDAFGLPAEQYAIQTGQHPEITTKENIERYRLQLDNIGFSFDWTREVRTTDVQYYKWTQWIFIQLFNNWYNVESQKAENIEYLIAIFTTKGNSSVKAAQAETAIFNAQEWLAFSENEQLKILLNYRLAYLSEAMVNWCPTLGTVLANDEIKDGVSERGGYAVERKLMTQWSLRISAYSERLLQGLEALDWTDSIKEAQRNWIGKSEGTSLKFEVVSFAPLKSNKKSLNNSEINDFLTETVDKDTYHQLIKLAKIHKENPCDEDTKLWKNLRDRQFDNIKFRKQYIINHFIVDFISFEYSLILEIDGLVHCLPNNKILDEERLSKLNKLGFNVLRFTKNEINTDIENVLNTIKNSIKNHKPNSPSSVENRQENEAKDYSRELTKTETQFVEVFTTRPDTIFGVSFLTLAPEHELVAQITTTEQKAAIENYITVSKNRSERERMSDVKTISGVFTGAFAKHPFTGKQIPIWIGDYVLAGYGTGAVMAVPAHDSRDYAFAKYFELPILQVVNGGEIETESYDAKEGELIHSDFLNGLQVKEAIKKAIIAIEAKGIGKGKTNFRLRDAVFGRQRYWGEPIPVYYKDGIPYCIKEKDLPIALPEVDKYLPTETGEPPLARAKDWNYNGMPLETTTMPGWAGSSWYYLRYIDAQNENELVSADAVNYWQNVDLYVGGSEHAVGHLLYSRFWCKFLNDIGKVPFDEPFKKLVNQGMIGGVISSVFIYEFNLYSETENKNYLMKFCMPLNLHKKLENKELSDSDILIHLGKFHLGSFSKISQYYLRNEINIPYNLSLQINEENFYQNLYDWINNNGNLIDKVIPNLEIDFNFKTETGKMSKRWHNVVNPDDICTQYGADTLRLYEMFLGPLQDAKPWSTQGIEGVHRFLKKTWRLFHNNANEDFDISNVEPTKDEFKILHKTIKKATDDIENFSFNTSVSAFMVCVNELQDLKCNKRAILEPFIVLLSPYAPHIAEELWKLCGNNESIEKAAWPIFNAEYLVENEFNYPVSFNGKVKFNLNFALDKELKEIENEVMANEQTQKYLEGKTPKKVIVVKGRIVNVVV